MSARCQGTGDERDEPSSDSMIRPSNPAIAAKLLDEIAGVHRLAATDVQYGCPVRNGLHGSRNRAADVARVDVIAPRVEAAEGDAVIAASYRRCRVSRRGASWERARRRSSTEWVEHAQDRGGQPPSAACREQLPGCFELGDAVVADRPRGGEFSDGCARAVHAVLGGRAEVDEVHMAERRERRR